MALGSTWEATGDPVVRYERLSSRRRLVRCEQSTADALQFHRAFSNTKLVGGASFLSFSISSTSVHASPARRRRSRLSQRISPLLAHSRQHRVDLFVKCPR